MLRILKYPKCLHTIITHIYVCLSTTAPKTLASLTIEDESTDRHRNKTEFKILKESKM